MSSQKKKNQQLVKAAREGRLEDMKRLVEEGADIDIGDGYNSPLILAANNGHVECVCFALEKGAAINGLNSKGCTALMAAAEEGYLEIIKILLAAGADIHLRGLEKTAEAWAAMHGHMNVVDVLRDAPAYVPNPDEVMVESPLGNRLLQEIFNFERLDRISLIRKNAFSDVEAMSRERFSEIEPRILRQVFDEYTRRGGRIEERAIFPNKLMKPAPLKGQS